METTEKFNDKELIVAECLRRQLGKLYEYSRQASPRASLVLVDVPGGKKGCIRCRPASKSSSTFLIQPLIASKSLHVGT